MRKILIIHPEFQKGGGEAVALWLIQALKNDFRLTLLTWNSLHIPSLNQFYGTSLQDGDFQIKRIRAPGVLTNSERFWLLKYHWAIHTAKRISSSYDLVISTFNEMDFGKPGIQYIHFPILAEDLLRSMSQLPEHWIYRDTLFRKLYRKLCLSVSGFSCERMKENVTLVNSSWTGKQVKKAYDLESQVVFPPIAGEFPKHPWEIREKGFLCIGRISPEKRIEKIINILRGVREVDQKIHLHIIGVPDKRFLDYYRMIKNLQKENASWIFLEENISRRELLEIMAQHKYGIHGMQYEHFGMAVAEMVKAGCIVFVPDSGGQVEILGGNNHLVYTSEHDASSKIKAILANEQLQYSLRNSLIKQRNLFSTEHFMNQIRKVIKNFDGGTKP